MKSRSWIFLLPVVSALLASPFSAGHTAAQAEDQFVAASGAKTSLFDPDENKKVVISAHLSAGPDAGSVVLNVVADMVPGAHMYSLTQPAGGPIRTVLTVAPSDDYEVGEFSPMPEPHVEQSLYFKNAEGELINEESHEGIVVWSAPLQLAAGIDPNELEVVVDIAGQVCGDTFGCIQVNEQLTATAESEISWSSEADEPIASETESDEAEESEELAGVVGELRPNHIHATVRAEITPAAAKPGDEITLTVTIAADEGWHCYQHEIGDRPGEAQGYLPTLIVISDEAGRYASPARTSSRVHKSEPLPGMMILSHEGTVTWHSKMVIPSDLTGDFYAITGLIGFQVCDDSLCDRPQGIPFMARIPLGNPTSEEPLLVTFTEEEVDYQEVEAVALKRSQENWPKTNSVGNSHLAEPSEADPGAAVAETSDTAAPPAAAPKEEAIAENADAASDGKKEERSTLWYMGMAVLAGLILNVMPCVLPVIGLKLMAFVQQAGENRTRVLMLNLWYSAGLISVFLLLATLAVVFNMGWAEQFQTTTFNIVLVAILFIFGLSFLGVWEIPIPGFVGSGKSAKMASRDGMVGAFIKGGFTTVLATPCAGPLLIPVLAWAFKQPPMVTYSIFALMGLGMAIPFLLIGAFPALIRFLPKPGAWMDTFKQIMGFILLAAMLFFCIAIESAGALIPTLMLLLGLAIACWWIGKIPIMADLKTKAIRWGTATAIAGVLGFIGFYGPAKLFFDIKRGEVIATVSGEEIPEIEWLPFSPQLLETAKAEGKTIFIDFTGDP